MTEDSTPTLTPSTTAGELLRQYRQDQDLQLDVLAQALRVSPAKIQALESNRLNDLPDAMFARALTLAICRQLKVDATPVLALLPGHDVSRLASKNERGLDFPLDRPSFLPQSSFVVVARLFTPMRWAALALLGLAVVIGFWPEIHGLLVFKDEATAGSMSTTVESPVIALPSTEPQAPVVENASGNMVVTTVHSAAVAAQAALAASASANASSAGGSDAK